LPSFDVWCDVMMLRVENMNINQIICHHFGNDPESTQHKRDTRVFFLLYFWRVARVSAIFLHPTCNYAGSKSTHDWRYSTHIQHFFLTRHKTMTTSHSPQVECEISISFPFVYSTQINITFAFYSQISWLSTNENLLATTQIYIVVHFWKWKIVESSKASLSMNIAQHRTK
jgi:hypothetical protein